jgi:hypothetical protein
MTASRGFIMENRVKTYPQGDWFTILIVKI